MDAWMGRVGVASDYPLPVPPSECGIGSIFDLLCITLHAAAGGGGDRDLRGAGDDAPPSAQSGNQVARGGGQGLPAVAEPIRGMGPGAHAPSWSR